MNLKTKKILLASTFILVFLVGTFGFVFLRWDPRSILIPLDKPMYLVDGTQVSSVELEERSGIILLKDINYENTNAQEEIRPGKSIRIGGYYYSVENFSEIEQYAQWIGETNDVFSLGICGAYFTPDNISEIRAINPDIKFYYMAFATTLFENPSNNYTFGEWGGTHYPGMKFNETMHSWTLKENNGEEAIAVRRKSDDSSAHVMDLGSSEWARYFSDIYSLRAEEYHADGIAIDEVMWQGYWNTKTYKLRDYQSTFEITQSCYDWLSIVNQNFRGEVITQAFWDEAQEFQDGVWGEINFRGGGMYGDRTSDKKSEVYYEDMNWMESIENLQHHSSQNRSYIFCAWFDKNDDDAREYALATYLMGKSNNISSTVFHPQMFTMGVGYPEELVGYKIDNMMEELTQNPEYYDIELGDALGDMELVETSKGKYYCRNFENGIVLVNPYRVGLKLKN